MITPSFTIDNSSINAVKAKVEIYRGPTLVLTCTCSDYLQSFTVNRTGEKNKFFGYGICQQLKMTLIDLERSLDIKKGNQIKVAYGDGTNFVYPHPWFYVEEVTRNEDNNALDIVAYDLLYKATEHKVSEIKNLSVPYTTFAFFVASIQTIPGGVSAKLVNSPQNITHDALPNFEGTETIRQAMDAAAEVAQVVYYMDSNNNLTLRRLDTSKDPVLTITRNDYFSLKTGDSIALDAICSATELGNNAIHPDTGEGNIQYMRDNPFLEFRTDISTFLATSWEKVSGLAINEFVCEDWLGNYLLEIGDKIAFETEDGSAITTYLLDDSVVFDGTLSETSQWVYEPSLGETATNPTSLGEALNQTFAKVDKVNKQITLLVNDVTEKQATTDSELKTIKENQTSFTQTATDITLRVESIETDGVTRVDTGTGFTFNEEGLRINKDNSGIENLLDNTGMYVKQDGTQVLSANEEGVKAKDLHAVTYLWIGSHSRFEDYEGGRTGCFWIS